MMTKKINHLYIHVPFCNSICFYCDFAHRTYDLNLSDKWLDQLENEIKAKASDQYETIYIGGGTPSCLLDSQLERLLSLIEPYSRNVVEYTIEVNPESLDLNKINLLNKYGINRISMGVQSSDNAILKELNRKHSFEDVQDKIHLLKKNGLTNISIDLMYSLPNQDMTILKKTLNDFMTLDIPHVSIYSLTVEENTVFGKKGIRSLDNDTEADMYEEIVSFLSENGYHQYEVSNFSKPGFESKHNLGYWKYEDFLGLSIGASSKIDNIRRTITRDFNSYLKDYSTYDEELHLTIDDLKFENIMMSLRTIYGLNIEQFNQKYNADLLKEYSKGVKNSNIEIRDGNLICTNLELLNTVLLDFMND